MPTNGPATEAVFALYYFLNGPSKPCQNTNVRVIFFRKNSIKREIVSD